jgi:uncharacterized protein YecE (DUF72 family)
VDAASIVTAPMLLRVGQDSLRGAFHRYTSRFDLLEVPAEVGRVPRVATLHQWREEAPEGFVFSVVLGGAVGRLVPGADFDEALAGGLKAAAALRAKWIVLRTGPETTPSKRNQQRLAEAVARLPRDSCRVAWEPRGLWEPEQEETICEALDLIPVRDLRRSEPAPGVVAYTRLLALGTGARFSMESADVIAERAAGFEELYVVVEGQGAWQGAQVLRQLLVEEPIEPDVE